jgi:hypothetical protein
MAMTREQYIAQFYESTDRDFTGVDLSSEDLSDCRWNYADFTGADLTSCDLTNAGGPGAIMNGADLTSATATRANFCRADLRDATTTSADFTDADLTMADLRETVLSSATLTGADLSGALRLSTDTAISGWDLVADWTTVRARDIAYQRALAGFEEDDLVSRRWTKLPQEPPVAVAAGDPLGSVLSTMRYLARAA